MFVKYSEIKDLLICENCSQLYEEYETPKMLPCCGNTICYKCVQLTENQVKNNKFQCIVCNDVDTIPKNGFQINQLAVKLLRKKPQEISRGPEADKLKKNIFELENLVNMLIFEIENGDHLITEDCKELRRQVQLVKEEKIEKINKHCDALFLKIDTYEEKCKNKYKEMNESKKKANELIRTVDESIQQQNAYLRQLKIDEKETMECNQKMEELIEKIENERKNIKKSMFGYQAMKFNANSSSIDEEFLGNLTLDFTKILIASFRSIKFLDLNTNECLKKFFGHSDWIQNVKLLNENQIVSCSLDKSIKIWDIATGDCIKSLLGHSDAIFSIEILSNNRIASCSSDNSIRIWNAESGDCIKLLNGHIGDVYSIVKHSNECILSCSSDKTIKLWNVNSGDCLKTFAGHQAPVYCVVSLSNERILSGSCDKTIKIWNFQTGDCLQILEGHTETVCCIQVLSQDRIVSGSEDGELRIWCLKRNNCIKTIKAHLKSIREIQVLNDNQAASCSEDNTIKIWDLVSLSCIKTIQCKKSVISIDVL